MATLDSLKRTLKCAAAEIQSPNHAQPSLLSDAQYSAGFATLAQNSESYRDFIIPQLSLQLESLLETRTTISILEIGPGPKSILGRLPGHLRRRISRYTAFEPNKLFASTLKEWLRSGSEGHRPLPCLEASPDVWRIPFPPKATTSSGSQDKFDVVLFCHSLYGMADKHEVVKNALGLLRGQSDDEMVVVFHRDGSLKLDGLACRHTAVFPTGVVHVRDDDEVLDAFADFIAGSTMSDTAAAEQVHKKYREFCRALGGKGKPGHLSFSSPEIKVTFEAVATNLSVLTAQVPLAREERKIKNREARIRHPAAVVRPVSIQQVQQCVRWALDNDFSLSIVGGSHSGNCLWSHVVAVDMGAFSTIHVLAAEREDGSAFTSGRLMVVGAGITMDYIIRATWVAGVTIPLGSRPSVGAGLWLQGGIGHLSRLRGLSSDSIVGAVIVSVADGQVMHIGCVPVQCRPTGSVRPVNDGEMLWMLKGAGTNLGVVISVTFHAREAPMYAYQNWIVECNDPMDTLAKLKLFDERIAGKLPKHCSADAYLFCEENRLKLGITVFEASTTEHADEGSGISAEDLLEMLGPGEPAKIVNGVGLFEAEMYMSGMHGGHAAGKTSSFKRCLFLKHIGSTWVPSALLSIMSLRPSPFCYLHLLHGGGAISEVAAQDTAFGCRDWDFACVVTGVWPRDQDGTATADAVIQWVYDVANNLLPSSSGVYAADLGPDPRDAELAKKAFGPNQLRLAQLKSVYDPKNVLAYACPLSGPPKHPQVIFLVTGESGAGKDYCADVWASTLAACIPNRRTTRVASISEAIKGEYAKTTGTDLERLLCDRTYKELHRPALTAYFNDRVRQQPNYPQENFLKLVHDNAGVDVLFVTGMREQGPVAAVSHLVPGTRVIEIRVQTNEDMPSSPRGKVDDPGHSHRCLAFDNNMLGDEAAHAFAEHHLLPFFDKYLLRLAKMVPTVADFPRPGVVFQDVLKIAQERGGLELCAGLMQGLATVEWASFDAIVGCEAGGFVFASALAAELYMPLVLVRKAGKLPPPTFSTTRSASHISSVTTGGLEEERIEVDRAFISKARSVAVVDDVLASGNTLRAVLTLLTGAGIHDSNITVMVVAEFPAHRGREMLCRAGFGRAQIQSLLVFEGA
jgi:adenine phosphoribosyltransferase/phosphomevalonate kinase